MSRPPDPNAPASPPTVPAVAPAAAGRRHLRVGVAVVLREGKVLIDRRGSGPLAGWWEFPGGKAEPGESIPDCIRRECREELGTDVEPGELLTVCTHDYPHGLVELHFHLCRLAGGEPSAVQVAELAWVAPDAMDGYRLLEANAPVVELLRRMGQPAGQRV